MIDRPRLEAVGAMIERCGDHLRLESMNRVSDLKMPSSAEAEE
jgi:hypothetical protein